MSMPALIRIGAHRTTLLRRYRAISRNSHIDESLFCSVKAGAKVRLPFNRPGKYGSVDLASDENSKRGLISAGRTGTQGSMRESTVLLRSGALNMSPHD